MDSHALQDLRDYEKQLMLHRCPVGTMLVRLQGEARLENGRAGAA